MAFTKNRTGLDFDCNKFLLRLDSKLASYWRPANAATMDVINPFVYRWAVPWYQWTKMLLVSFTLLPFRILGFVTAFSLAYLIAVLVLAGQSDRDIRKPMAGWRKNVMLPVFLALARIAYFFSSVHWVTVRGTRCSPSEAPILVLAPHSAFMDSLFVVYLGMNSVIGKIETANSLVGYLLRMTQPILVAREDPDSRQHTIDDIRRRCDRVSENWPQLLIFPEGTCTNRSCLISFKTGAFIPGVPVQPVVLRWPNRLDYITWTWHGPGVLLLLWMLFTQLHTFVDIEFLPVYHPSEEEKCDPRLYADNVRAVMARSLDVPTTNYSYEDCRLMTLTRKHGLPFAEVIIEFSRMHERLLLINHGDPLLMLERLLAPLEGAAGISVFLSLPELCQWLSMADYRAPVERVFRFYDKSDSGLVDARDLLCHLALFSLPSRRALALEYSLRAYRAETSTNEDGAASYVIHSGFGLSPELVSQTLALVQSRQSTPGLHQPFHMMLDDVMATVTDPFDMYSSYFSEYNQSISKYSVTNMPPVLCSQPSNGSWHSSLADGGGDTDGKLSQRRGGEGASQAILTGNTGKC